MEKALPQEGQEIAPSNAEATKLPEVDDGRHPEKDYELGIALPVWGGKRSLVVFTVLFILLIPVFWVNALGSADTKFFDSWQRDSEALVLSTIEQNRVGSPAEDYGLTIPRPDRYGPYETIDLPSVEGNANLSTEYEAYPAQLGFTGHFYSAISQYTPCSSLSCLHLAASTLFSFVLTALVYLLGLVTRRRSFAIIFLLSVVGSPWLVAAARNLYWSPWMWLLPACAAAVFVLAEKLSWRIVSLIFMFLAFAMRFASGYEYLTSLSLLAVSIPILGFIFTRDRNKASLIRAMRDAAIILVVSVASFSTVLLVHARIRGEGSIGAGVGSIWREDVLRRTYAASEGFQGRTAASLEASPFSVLKKYIFGWNTELATIGYGTPFRISFGSMSLWVLLCACLLIVAFQFSKRGSQWSRDLALLAVAFAIPLSWFVLAKGHSFIHTHISFALWYLLPVGVLFFIIYDFGVNRRLAPLLRDAIDRARVLRE